MPDTSPKKLDASPNQRGDDQALPRCQLEELEALRKEKAQLLAKIDSVNAENEKLAKENADLKKRMDAAEQSAIVVMTALLKAANIEFKPGEDLPKADLNRLHDILDNVASTLLTAAQCNGILKYAFSKKSEKTKSLFKAKEPSKEELEHERDLLEKKLEGIKAQQKALETGMGHHRKHAKTAQTMDPDDPTTRAVAGIADHPMPESPEQDDKTASLNGKLTAGRQAIDKEGLETLNLFNNGQAGHWEFKCPCCGKTNAWKQMGQKEVVLRTVNALVSEMLRSCNVEVSVFQCECGFMHQEFPEGASVPCCEKQGTLSMALVVQAGVTQTIGLPVNRIEGMLIPNKEEIQIGSDTLLRNTHRWADSGPGGHLMTAMLESARSREGIAFDETPTEILQPKGKSKKKVKSVSKTGNVLVISSLPGDSHPFAVYNRTDGRSVNAIKAALDEWMPKVVVTDGCTTYDTVLEEMQADHCLPEAIQHQVCCVHFRRLCLKAIDIPAMNAVLQGPNGEAATIKGICGKKPEFLMLSVVDAFSKIYAYEETLQRQPNEDIQAWQTRIRECRQKHAAPLMDDIDRLMKTMTPMCARFEKGRWVSLNKTAPVNKAVVYYLNHRDGLRHFLTDPRVPPDSNVVERAIRFYVLYKQAAHFKQSTAYNDSLCVWFSLAHTGRMCGIKDVARWLVDFSEAYYKHCYDWTLTRQWEQGSKSLYVEAFDPEVIDKFDFEPWLPWNYAAAEHA